MKALQIALRATFFVALGLAVFVASVQTVALVAAGCVLVALLALRSLGGRRPSSGVT